jgi:predicted small metal-binding protein
MARQITCECGYVVRAETEDELLELTYRHLRSDHPGLADRVTREDLVNLIEVVE